MTITKKKRNDLIMDLAMKIEDELEHYTVKDLSEYLGISRQTLHSYRSQITTVTPYKYDRYIAKLAQLKFTRTSSDTALDIQDLYKKLDEIYMALAKLEKENE